MANIFEQINSLKKELDSLPSLTLEQRELLDRKIRLEFNYNSNHIEGNTLTYGETRLLLFFDKVHGENHTHREYEEMKSSDVALSLIEELAKDKERPLTESFIKNLNKVILVRPYWKEAETAEGQKTQREILIGDYKKYPNSVRLQNGEIFHYASPHDVPFLMGELMEWFQKKLNSREVHAVELAALLHYKFVSIHPFDDGNGRISRLIMNYVLLFHDFPPVIIKSTDKKKYLNALQEADAGNLDFFIEYIGKQLLWSLSLFMKVAKNENIEEEEDWRKELKLLKNELGDRDEIKVLRSLEIVTSIVNQKIAKFIEDIRLNIVEFDDLFLGIGIISSSDGRTFFEYKLRHQFGGNYIMELMDNVLIFRFVFTDFKRNGLNPFSFGISLFFKFDQYNYSLSIEGDATFLLTKLYHQDFTDDDVEMIVNKLGKIITNEIKKNVKS